MEILACCACFDPTPRKCIATNGLDIHFQALGAIHDIQPATLQAGSRSLKTIPRSVRRLSICALRTPLLEGRGVPLAEPHLRRILDVLSVRAVRIVLSGDALQQGPSNIAAWLLQESFCRKQHPNLCWLVISCRAPADGRKDSVGRPRAHPNHSKSQQESTP